MRALPGFRTTFQLHPCRAALAAFLLSGLGVGPIFAQANPVVAYDTLVLVDFPARAFSGLWPILKSELRRSETPKLLGGSLRLLERDEFQKGMEFGQGYQIILHGDCRMAAPSNSQGETRGPLGWVPMVNGQIQPFVYVDCDRVRQMLHRDLRNKTTAERQRILARAISRIIAHELTHVVTQSSRHAASGLEKAHVTSSDLLGYSAD